MTTEPGWQRSSYCGTGTCVEVAVTPDHILVRDSKQPGAVLRFSPDEWAAFLEGVRHGEFDD